VLVGCPPLNSVLHLCTPFALLLCTLFCTLHEMVQSTKDKSRVFCDAAFVARPFLTPTSLSDLRLCDAAFVAPSLPHAYFADRAAAGRPHEL
jgi:hypothetical protein